MSPRHRIARPGLGASLSQEPLAVFRAGLGEWRARGRERRLETVETLDAGEIVVGGRRLLNLAGNDYLGMSRHPEVIGAAREAISKWGTGSGASRLLGGTLPPHAELESYLADYHGFESALLFTSGFAANTAVLPALGEGFGHIYCDRNAHASLLDGVLASGVPFHRFGHNRMAPLEALLRRDPGPHRSLVIAEVLYSMDGDWAPLSRLGELQSRYGCSLYLDAAHAIGGYREWERVLRSFHPEKTYLLATFGKALGGMGAAVSCNRVARDYLIHRCRGFVYSTAPPAAAAAAALAALRVLSEDEGPRRELERKSRWFREAMQTAGVRVLGGPGHIVPWVIGEAPDCLRAQQRLFEAGFYAPAIRPPTVPAGGARLRFSIHRRIEQERLGELARLCGRLLRP